MAPCSQSLAPPRVLSKRRGRKSVQRFSLATNAKAFAQRSCSIKGLKRDDDSTKSHRALANEGMPPAGSFIAFALAVVLRGRNRFHFDFPARHQERCADNGQPDFMLAEMFFSQLRIRDPVLRTGEIGSQKHQVLVGHVGRTQNRCEMPPDDPTLILE